MPTSTTYDQGRDARSIAGGQGSHRVVVCATIDKNIESKVEKDAAKLAATSTPERVVYCYSGKLSESAIDKLVARMRTSLPSATSITFLSLQQIADLAVKYPDTFKHHYPAELQAIEATLTRFETTGEQGDASLRLALMTLASEDARLLREDISQKAVLQVLLSAGLALPVSDIAYHLSRDLRLPQSINHDLLETALNVLVDREQVVESEQGWVLTSSGVEEATSISSDVAQDILLGAAVVRKALEELTGYKLTDTQFAPLWSTLLDYLSNLFHTKGLAVIAAINDFLSAKVNSTDQLEEFVARGAAQIRAVVAIPEMGEALEQAVIDILTERSGPAFEWVSKVCERFVALCSIGLEASSTDEIRQVIGRHKLILDSDIVITLLCPSERGHTATREIIGRWLRLGGRILLAAPVLEEVAYHAYISDREFHDTRHLGPSLSGVDLRRYCNNAFVRAFYEVETDYNKWPTFRDMYVAATPHDYSKILEVLQDLIVVEFMPPLFDEQLAQEMKQYLVGMSSEQEQVAAAYFADPGRMGRDGQLLATIARKRAEDRAVGSDARILILSSSARLRMADNKFRHVMGVPEAVISRSAMSYLIALVPEAGLSVGALRKALFDFGETAHLADTERFALRVIRDSGSYVVPWAQRPHLKRQLESNLRREAEKVGIPARQFKIAFAAGKEKTHPAAVIAKTITDMALTDPDKVKLRGRVKELERELEVVTNRGRKKTGRKSRKGRRFQGRS